MKNYIIFAVFASFLFILPVTAKAGQCYADPVVQKNATAKIVRAVFLNDKPCMTGKEIIKTLSAGFEVKVVGWEDGWYAVEYGGYRGWIGQQFAEIFSDNGDGPTYSYDEFAELYPSVKPVVAPVTVSPELAASLLARVKGSILLQTESHGEAWYVDPVTSARYYMKDGPIAYQMMRSFGLGVSEADYAKIASGNYDLKKRLAGRIVLRAQAHGEAYYIHPKTLAVHYLQNGDEAYRVMRLYSLGITNADLGQITAKEIAIK